MQHISNFLPKTIVIDWNSIDSIEKAEKKQAVLINKGYNLIETKPLGVQNVVVVYQIEKKYFAKNVK